MSKETWIAPVLSELSADKTMSGPTYDPNEDPFRNFYGPTAS